MNRNIIIVAVLAVLVIISAVQAFQLNDLKEKVSSGKVGSAAAPVVSTGGNTAGASDISNLPQMVGGC